ncbi:hypothetical protein AB0K09_18995 [Streptomyces sp. NPDC049577]|uniref:hypothetical protein n=1 Tax=Streptomyces sp. NPDC049577 TaxID=3155153 RepID=UPI003433D577
MSEIVSADPRSIAADGRAAVQAKLPEWTGQAGDAGTELIEVWAHMAAKLRRNVNRVPEQALDRVIGDITYVPSVPAMAEFLVEPVSHDQVEIPAGAEVVVGLPGAETVVFTMPHGFIGSELGAGTPTPYQIFPPQPQWDRLSADDQAGTAVLGEHGLLLTFDGAPQGHADPGAPWSPDVADVLVNLVAEVMIRPSGTIRWRADRAAYLWGAPYTIGYQDEVGWWPLETGDTTDALHRSGRLTFRSRDNVRAARLPDGVPGAGRYAICLPTTEGTCALTVTRLVDANLRRAPGLSPAPKPIPYFIPKRPDWAEQVMHELPECGLLLPFMTEPDGGTIVVVTDWPSGPPHTPPWTGQAKVWTARGWMPTVAEQPTAHPPGRLRLRLPAPAAPLPKGSPAPGRYCLVVPTAEPTAVPGVHIWNLPSGTVGAVRGVHQGPEDAGVSTGEPGQRFPLLHRPLPVQEEDEPLLETIDRWGVGQLWSRVESFAGSGPGDRHFRLDHQAGEVVFGPLLTGMDGVRRQFGAVPPAGARIRVGRYVVSDAAAGRVPAGAPGTLRPGNDTCTLTLAGQVAGRDARTARSSPWRIGSGRVVSLADCRDAALCLPRVGRAELLGHQVLVVPAVGYDAASAVSAVALTGAAAGLATDVRRRLEPIAAGTVPVGPMVFVSARITVTVTVPNGPEGFGLRQAVTAALLHRYHPLAGGDHGTGWPVGTAITAEDVQQTVRQACGGLASTGTVDGRAPQEDELAVVDSVTVTVSVDDGDAR